MTSHNNISQTQFSIPGISNPVVPEKANKRRFTEFDGSIRTKVFGPITCDEQDPSLDVYITLDFLREIESQFSDCKNEFIIKEEKDGSKNYYLVLNTKNFVLSRGSYNVKVVSEGKLVNEFVLVSTNEIARPDALQYKWPVLSSTGSTPVEIANRGN